MNFPSNWNGILIDINLGSTSGKARIFFRGANLNMYKKKLNPKNNKHTHARAHTHTQYMYIYMRKFSNKISYSIRLQPYSIK